MPALFIQIVKLSNPVKTDGENVNIIFLNIIYLLIKVILNNYLISVSCNYYRLNTLKNIVTHV